MRLLRVRDLEFEEFFSENTPGYGILSHTWDEEEVAFQTIKQLRAEGKHEMLACLKGWAKISHSAELAAKDGYGYIWLDTCCIDKTSSTELSEAINSMYKWYQNSETTCYVYLADVPSDEDPSCSDSFFKRSRWFRRGWTLQELIAPRELVFYAQDWKKIGTKLSLKSIISRITGIDIEVLEFKADPVTMSVARRMSWASGRQTTRTEDIAYCLLGIFDVNMPLLYGEGSKAFLRLQEEIMKHSDDHSLFAWKTRHGPLIKYSGLLASSPSDFAASADYVPFRNWEKSSSYFMTNRGLNISLPLRVKSLGNDLYSAGLDCRLRPNSMSPDENDLELRCCILLKKLAAHGQQYARVMPNIIETTDLGYGFQIVKNINIQQNIVLPDPSEVERMHGCLIPKLDDFSDLKGYKLVNVYPDGRWNPKTRVLQLFTRSSRNPANSSSGFLVFVHPRFRGFVLRLGVEFNEILPSYARWGVSVWSQLCHIDLGETRDEIDKLPRPPNKDLVNRQYLRTGNGRVLSVKLEQEVVQGQRMFVVNLGIIHR